MLMGGKPEVEFAERLHQITRTAQDILDIGTSARFAKELRPYESLFDGKQYTAAGYHPSMSYGKYNCDCHQDIEKMTFEDASFDAVICLEVLEHVTNPFQAVAEIKRVLRESGKLLLTVPFMTQYHGKGSQSQGHEHYPDFWRFTHEGLQQLFGDFQKIEIIPLDGPIEVRLKQLYCTRLLKISMIRRLIDTVDHRRVGKATSRHMVFGVK